MQDQRKFSEAVTLLRGVLRRIRKDNPEVCVVLFKLGATLGVQSNCGKALLYYKRLTTRRLDALLEHVGVDLNSMVFARFLGACWGSEAVTQTVMLTFKSKSQASVAASALHGQEVATASGDVKCLVARVHDNDNERQGLSNECNQRGGDQLSNRLSSG